MSSPIIKVENLGKKYRIGGPVGRFRYKTLRDTLMDVPKALYRRLRRLTFEELVVAEWPGTWLCKTKGAAFHLLKWPSELVENRTEIVVLLEDDKMKKQR